MLREGKRRRLALEKSGVRCGGDGRVDNKVCEFSEAYTALRFVIPVWKR